MKKKAVIFRGVAAVMAFVMLLGITATTLTFKYDSIINSALQINVTRTVVSDDPDAEQNAYYENEIGYTEYDLVDAYTAAASYNIQAEEEGIVLLKNENQALPLASGSRVTIFGNAAVNSDIEYRQISHHDYSTSTLDYLSYVNFVDAMRTAFGEDNVNTELCTNVYADLSMSSIAGVVEADIDSIKQYENTWQSDYNDAAIVVITREGGEGSDLPHYASTETYEDGSTRRFLDLTANEQDMMEYLAAQKQAGVFDKIVVLLVSEYPMELGFLNDYQVDSALQVGECGSFGCTAIGEVLTGAVNPSGHLTDTYATNSLSAPAVTYANVDGIARWSNFEEINAANPNDNEASGDHIDWYTIYAEGVYVGYKYYETRYEDTILASGNADSKVGSSTGNAWNYKDEVLYPFGYGLSYTNFNQTLDSVSYDAESDAYQVTVTVTNVGDVAGKDVVEVYAQTPYGDYEKANQVEKPSVALMAYGKTDMLQPGENQTLTVPVSRYMLASYDTNGAKGYILSEGTYYISIGDDAHDAMNNILAAKGYTVADGMTADGEATNTYAWTEARQDAETYAKSVYTDAGVTNTFDEADINYYGYDFTYLSRNDWEGTYPQEMVQLEATDAIVNGLGNDWYDKSDHADVSVDDFTQGQRSGLTLLDMLDVDLGDEKWNSFIDQLTVEEMVNLTGDDITKQVVSELDIVGNSKIDDNLNGGGDVRFISECNTAHSWNVDLAARRAYLIGVIAACRGCDEVWYGGGDLHRTPFGGRANQYWSEDGNFGYHMGYAEAQAMQEIGVTYCVKHFVLNDQDTHREGVSTFTQEQPLREIYLRAFEGAFAGGALSTMCGLNRIGIMGCAKSQDLLTTVLKNEWGFKGHVTNDGYTGAGYQQDFLENLVAGMDYSCMDTSGDYAAAILKAVNDGDGYILQCLREATKRNLYVMAHSVSINEVYSGGAIYTIVPMWKIALLVVDLVSLIGLATFTVLAVVSSVRKKEGNVRIVQGGAAGE